MTPHPLSSTPFPYTTLFRSMSGRLPSRTGAYDNAAEFRSDIPTFAHYLRRAGYRMILSGKMHFCGPDQLQDRKSTRLNSSHLVISYAVFFLEKKININHMEK